MASPASSEWRFFSAAGSPLAGPLEWESCWIEPPAGPADLERCAVERHGVDLPLQVRKAWGAVRLLADWPRSGPGHYRLALRGPVPSEAVLTIEPRKLTPAAYQALLDDLSARLPASIATGLQRAGALGGLDLRPPSELTLGQEMARLRIAVRGAPPRPGLVRVLAEVARRPHELLHARTEWKPRRLARRPHPTSLVRALVAAGNMHEGLPERIPDRLVEPTVDVYENRLVRLFVQQVEVRLRAVRRAAGGKQLSALAAEAEALLDELALAVRRAAFLRDVTLVPALPLEPTMVLMRAPAYRAAFEAFLEFRRSPWVTVRFDEPRLQAPLRNLPLLYQAWGGLVLLDVLLKLAAERGFLVEQQRLTRRSQGDLWIRLLPQGPPLLRLRHPSGVAVALQLEPAYTKHGAELRSLSFQQRPDVVVRVQGGGRDQLYLFDPKYKLDGELDGEKAPKPRKVDVDKMHAYRDAIRAADGGRVVEYASVLYPGDFMSFGGVVEALPAVPGSAAALEEHLRRVLGSAFDEVGVGVGANTRRATWQ